MTEKGWFHPSRGYWQTTGDVPPEYVESYPEGTSEVPVKPGSMFVFDESTKTWSAFEHGRDVRLQLARAECRRRIYAVASMEAQMNIGTAVSLASAKAASARSAGEKRLLNDAAGLSDWIASMRDAVSAVADAGVNIAADEAWPPCPNAVLALAATF